MKKRIFSLLLVLVLAASALSITASAYSNFKSGFFRGQKYNAKLYVCKDYASADCIYAGGGDVTCIMTVTWHRDYEDQNYQTVYTNSIGSNGHNSTTFNPYGSWVITRANAIFGVNLGVICSLTATSY